MTQSAPPPVTHSTPPPVTHPSAPQQKPAKPPPPTTGVSVNKMHAVQTARRLLDDEIFVTAGLFRNWLFFLSDDSVPSCDHFGIFVAMSNK